MKKTERLSNAYEMAFEVALDKRHEFVTPEHLLYGIAHQDELEAIFTSYQVDPILFRVELLDYLDQHIDTVPEEAGNYELLASAQLIQVIAISEQMAASSGHDEVDIPHALNAIMHLEDSQALYAIVHSFTDDPGEFLNCVVMAMNGETLPLHASPQEDSYDDDFDDISSDRDMDRDPDRDVRWRNLVTCINDHLADHNPLIGREAELDRTIQVLCRREKNNPLHVGEPGVGKTALVYGLAERIERGDVPERLRGATIYQMDIHNIVNKD